MRCRKFLETRMQNGDLASRAAGVWDVIRIGLRFLGVGSASHISDIILRR